MVYCVEMVVMLLCQLCVPVTRVPTVLYTKEAAASQSMSTGPDLERYSERYCSSVGEVELRQVTSAGTPHRGASRAGLRLGLFERRRQKPRRRRQDLDQDARIPATRHGRVGFEIWGLF